MSPPTVTPEPPSEMPNQPGLLRRGMRYYTNFKVPKELISVLRKDHIREALGTSDYREACSKITFQRMRWQTLFEKEQRQLAPKADGPREKEVLLRLTEQQAYEMACRFLIEREREFRAWWDQEGLLLTPEELDECKGNVSTDSAAFGAGSAHHTPEDGSSLVKQFLQAEGYDCPPTSPAFQMLRPLFRAAQQEHSSRSLDMLEGRTVKARDTHFRKVFAHVEVPEKKRDTTLAELLERFTKHLKDANRSPATFLAYEMPFRLLRETLKPNIGLSSITKDSIQAVCDVLRNMPQNSKQRYKGLTLPQAVMAANKTGDKRRVKKRTQSNYFNTLVAIFNFAVEKRLMAENPAKDRYFRRYFQKEKSPPKAQFTIAELNTLFKAPLYTGCQNDEGGYAIAGPQRPKRGRYWVPLLALFHGLRLNEACQLLLEDVKEQLGIPFLAIRPTKEDGSDSEKRIKAGIRDVPLHPMLIKLGFLDFVKARRKTKDSRLFPELPGGATGYFSNAFSKYFGRFCEAALGYKPKGTFHSFRHQFRDACRAARLPTETVALLGGWENGKGEKETVMNQYGRGDEYFRVLAEDLAKVTFPGLNLNHLVPSPASPSKKHRSIRER